MIRRILLTAAATAVLAFAPSPALAQDEAPSADEIDAMGEMMGGLFGEAEPLTAEQEARLPIATQVVEKLFPDGTYAKMMEETMQPMMNGIMGKFGENPALSVAQLTGVSVSDLQQLDAADLAEVASLLDPSANDRNAAMGKVSVSLITEVMSKIEPAYRVGLTRAYATRFTQAELTELNEFFSTKTGGHYAAESFLIYADPQVMSAMNEMMPAMMEMMPKMMEGMAEVNEQFPAARRFSDLSAAEREQLATLLGRSVSELESLSAEDETDYEDEIEAAADAAAGLS